MTCPTCGGGWVDHPDVHDYPCPDCVDGTVPTEQPFTRMPYFDLYRALR